MGADKKPYHGVAFHDSDGTIIVRYSRRPTRAYFLEPNGRVARINQPKLVLLDGQFLNDWRQTIVAVQKLATALLFIERERPAPPGTILSQGLPRYRIKPTGTGVFLDLLIPRVVKAIRIHS